MNIKNKNFKYKNYDFNIKVELFTEVERRANGAVWHRITINDLGQSNFYQKKEVLDANLEREIFSLEQKAKDYVDDKASKRDIDIRLENLGFE